MEKEQTTPIGTRISLSLLSEVHQEIQNTNQTMSQFLKEAVEEKLCNQNKERLDNELNYYSNIVNILKRKKEVFKEKEKHFLKIPKIELPFLIDTKKLIEDDPTFIKGRISLYKNKFAKHYRISDEEFFKLLDAAENQNQEKRTMGELKIIKNERIT